MYKNLRFRLWRLYNALARATSWAFVVVGAMATIIQFVTLLMPDGRIYVQGQPVRDPGLQILGCLITLAFAVVGFMGTRAKSYYPPDLQERAEQTTE